MIRVFWGKIIGLMVVPVFGVEYWTIIICVGIGHLFDVIYPSLPFFRSYFNQKVKDRLVYQKISEEFVFVYVYSIMFLNLDTNRAFSIFKKETSISNSSLRNIEGVYRYYTDVYLVENGANAKILGRRLTESFKILKFGYSQRMSFFRIIENVFDQLVLNPSQEDIEKLKRIANILKINYVRSMDKEEDVYVYQNTKSGAYQQSYESFEEKEEDLRFGYNRGKSQFNDDVDIKGLLTNETIEAFKSLGVSKSNISRTTLIDAKKAYKKKVKENHPDFMSGQVFSEKERKQAENKLTKLNTSIEIIKKYLANA